MLQVEVALQEPALAGQGERSRHVGRVVISGPERHVPDLELAAAHHLNDQPVRQIDVRNSDLRDRDDQHALVEDPVALEVGFQRKRRRALVRAHVDGNAVGAMTGEGADL